MRVILAEKPSVARDIARVLGCSARADGCLRGSSDVVTWAFGHLVEIAEPEAMNPAWARPWRQDQLPMVPSSWRYDVRPDAKAQFGIVKRLLLDSATTEVVCATDAGREGEHIFRLIYEAAGCRKPVKRLWISSLTDEAIKDGFRRLQPATAFDALAAAARSRATADWIVGLNSTRAYTLRNGQLCTIGRVQTPTLALVVARQREIEAFVPRKYAEVHARFLPGPFLARLLGPDGKVAQLDDAAAAKAVADQLAPVPAGTVRTVEQKDRRIPPPALFDLLTLQKVANKRYGLSAADTLATAQSLYEEKKLITYPRTESRHLSHDMVPKLGAVIAAMPDEYREVRAAAQKRLEDGAPLGKAYVDDAKLTDHHAIIPTTTREPAQLSLRERQVYRLVVERFLGIFLPDAVRAETLARIDLGSHQFRAAGSVLKERGWMVVGGAPEELEKGQDEDAQALPPLAPGQSVPKQDVQAVERTTRPPAPYNDATLLAAMKSAGQKLEDEELAEAMKASGLGTAATRAAIIERLIKSDYLVRERKALKATPKGVAVIDQVEVELKDPALTAAWERRLHDIEEGRTSAQEFDRAIEDHVRDLVQRISTREAVRIAAPEAAPGHGAAGAIGPCPCCKQGSVKKTAKGWGCDRWREGCKFTIWGTVAGKKITERQAIDLVAGRTTRPLSGFKSKEGRAFEAALRLDVAAGRVQFVFDR